ncbi:histidine-containing phosphotransfer protein 1-like [Gossypium australe]|uniref:Histidine-containing phosphotransfer protein n=1 Tax=Gossypium australe TaxID=47621 RepID=A0A5B6WXL9_9ROSI|nr:histidine-containing phosphotransfer protein 1-like [Gossypium australe]
MAGSSTDPTQQLNDYIRTMHDQGILDDKFDQLLALRREQNPRFINELISMFTNDAEACIAEITNALSLTEVDFSTIITKLHQLKGSTSGIGGHRMYQACCEFRVAAADGDKDRCDELFLRVKEEFNTLKQCFDSISEMRRNIISNGTRRRRRRPL